MRICYDCTHVEMCGWVKEVKGQGCEFFDDGMVWIPCSERLPEEYDEYLCQYDDGSMIVGWLENAEWCKKFVAKEKIIAWMPLPEPYKGGEKWEFI